jgi:hypothetical protein
MGSITHSGFTPSVDSTQGYLLSSSIKKKIQSANAWRSNTGFSPSFAV